MTANLYWKNAGKIRSLVETPFKSEQELENYIFANQEILGGDISIVERQIRTGNKQGIPDMLGIDQDARICILELKNVEADDSILPQALSYAIWAETNPDSIKAIWLESKRKPDNIQPNWDHLDIRIILIAPSFSPAVPHMVGKINYPVDLIEIRRYGLDGEEFTLVENVSAPLPQRVTTTKVMGDWSWDYYESEHGAKATGQFKNAVESLANFVIQQGWTLSYSLMKHYTGFKLENRIVFSVGWGSPKTWNIAIKLPENAVKDGFKGSYWEFQRYDRDFKEAVFRAFNLDTYNVDELKPFLLAAYDHIAGRK